MRGLIICFVAIFLFEASVARANPPASPSDKYEKVIQQIANDIGALKTEYPMLSKFDTEQNVDLNALSIEYAHNTESLKVNAGWRAGVPAPEKNGVWFYIDLHDVGSSKQLHTQPLSAGLYCYAGKLVAILILQGAKTKPFSKPLMEILHRNGVRPCAG